MIALKLIIVLVVLIAAGVVLWRSIKLPYDDPSENGDGEEH